MNIVDQRTFYILKKLKQFLIENNAYSNYMGNLCIQYKINNESSFNELLNKLITTGYPQSCLINLIQWNSTKEGDRFWRKLDHKFKWYQTDIIC